MLGLLKAVHQNESLTQRVAAKEVGVALGLVNTYLKRCIKKGFVKVSTAPRSRYSYYLTPQGFAEKSRLTGEYLSISFNLFRNTRTQYTKIFQACAENGLHNIAFAGICDLTEIAMMCTDGHDVKLIALIDPASDAAEFAGLPIYGDLSTFDGDAVIITDLRDPQGTYDDLSYQLPRDRILFPDMLNVSRDKRMKGAH